MKYATTFFYLVLLFGVTLHASIPTSMELTFVKNEGQWHDNVKYKSDLMGGLLYLERDRLTFLFSDVPDFHDWKRKSFSGDDVERARAVGYDTPDPIDYVIRSHAYQMIWKGASKDISIRPRVKQDYFYNYILGSNSSKWKSGVPIFKNLYYEGIYPGIDFNIYSQDVVLKSDYIVHPGVDYKLISMLYEGVDGLQVNKEGHLVIITSVNTVTEHKPIVYQEINGERIYIPARYKLKGREVKFELLESYRKDLPLIIDPTLVFSTYSGSRADNWGSSATHDSRGNMFVGGIALAADYPTTLGAFQEVFGGGESSRQTDVVITKFSSDGTMQLYSTFLGGSGNEVLSSLYCTPQDELIALMTTGSANFPVGDQAAFNVFSGGSSTTFQGGSIPFFSGTDIAIVKFTEDGRAIRGGTYFGGSDNDGANRSIGLLYNHGDETRGDIGLDSEGNIYIVSTTYSNNIPITAGVLQSALGGDSDAIIAKFDKNLSQILFSTYYGGAGSDGGYGILVDADNHIYICGGTRSSNLIGMNGVNTNLQGNTDGFVLRIRPDGGEVLSGTYLGTNEHDQAFLMDFDRAGDLYVFGQTLGAYPVSNNVYTNLNSRHFIHKLNRNLNQSLLSTVFGTTNSERVNLVPTAFMVDICDNIYAVGWGGVANQNNGGNLLGMPVTSDGWRTSTFGTDFYLINLSSNIEELRYATFFGEDLMGARDHVDGGTSRFDRFGVVYQAVCASCGGRNSFPTTPGAFGPNNLSNNCNMAGFKFRFDLEGMQITSTTAEPQEGCLPFTSAFSFTATQEPVSYLWDFGDGNISNERNPSHSFLEPGIYEVKLMVFDPDNCNPVDSSFVIVKVKERNDPTDFTFDNECGSLSVTFTVTDGDSSTVSVWDFGDGNISQGAGTITHVYEQEGNYTVTMITMGECPDTIANLISIRLIDLSGFQDTIVNCKGEIVALFPDAPDGLLYLWKPDEDLIPNGTVGNPSVSVLSTSTFFVTITNPDDPECFIERSVIVIVPDSLVLDVSDNIVLCQSQETIISASSETGISFTWRDGEGNIIGSDATLQFTPLVDDTISVTVVDKFGCELSRTVSIEILQIVLTLEGNNPMCLGDTVALEVLLPDASNVVEYMWSPADQIIGLPNEKSIRVSPLQTTTYTIEVVLADNCILTADYSIVVVSFPSNICVFELPRDTIFTGESTEICVQFNPNYEYVWQPEGFIDGDNTGNCIRTINLENDVEFTVTITFFECEQACSTTLHVTDLICEEPYIFVPNTFSPNGDGVNDILRVRAFEAYVLDMEFAIYNRWGQEVFRTTDISKGWDGTFKGEQMPIEAYGYYLKVSCVGGDTFKKTGSITLIK